MSDSIAVAQLGHIDMPAQSKSGEEKRKGTKRDSAIHHVPYTT